MWFLKKKSSGLWTRGNKEIEQQVGWYQDPKTDLHCVSFCISVPNSMEERIVSVSISVQNSIPKVHGYYFRWIYEVCIQVCFLGNINHNRLVQHKCLWCDGEEMRTVTAKQKHNQKWMISTWGHFCWVPLKSEICSHWNNAETRQIINILFKQINGNVLTLATQSQNLIRERERFPLLVHKTNASIGFVCFLGIIFQASDRLADVRDIKYIPHLGGGGSVLI